MPAAIATAIVEAYALSQGIGVAVYAAEIATLTTAFEVVAVVGSLQSMREQQRRAKNQATDAYNASQQDRYVMIRGAAEPRQLVLGRQRVSGPMVGPWSYGANKEHLVFCLPLAAHEIDAVEAVYFDDEQIILDGSSNVTGINRRDEFTISTATGAFTIRSTPKAGTVSAVVKYGTTTTTLTVDSVVGTTVSVSGANSSFTGTVVITYQPDPSPYAINKPIIAQDTITLAAGIGSVTLAQTPISGSVHVSYNPIDPTQAASLDAYVTSISGAVVSVNASAPGYTTETLTVTYQYGDVSSRARVRVHLGGASQVASPTMISNLAGIWTSAHVGNSLAYLEIEFDYDQEAFPGGIPNVSALVRGAKVLDERTGVTAWSENPALLMRYVAVTAPWGKLDPGLVNSTKTIAAANDCDVSSTYVVNGQTYTRARYTAGLTVKAGTRCVDVLNDLAAAMAGKWTFVDGLLCVKAGSYSTPLQTLDETWLAGGAIQIQPRANRTDVFNVVTGKFADELQDYQFIDYPRVAATPYIAEDGLELPHDVQLNAVTFGGQAQQVVAVMMRDARQGIRVTLTCNMRAFAVEVFDNIYVNLARYGWVNKVFEVLDVSFSLEGGIVLTLKETDASIWALGTAFSATDPAPNTLLPPPFQVQDIAGLSVSSGSYTGANTEGMTATWTAAVDPGVRETGGGIEIRYGLATLPEAQWQSVSVPGTATKALLSSVRPEAIYLVIARAFKTTPSGVARGKWTAPLLHKVSASAVLTDTLGLIEQSATELVPTFVSSVNGTPFGLAAGGGAVVAGTTFTPPVNCDAIVRVMFEAQGSSSDWESTMFARVFAVPTANISGGAFTVGGANQVGASGQTFTITRAAYSISDRFTVTGGTPYTFGLEHRNAISGQNIKYWSIRIAVEVIKR